MCSCSELIQRVISRAGAMSPRTRREVERELRVHLEDAIEDLRSHGHDESEILQLACDRFGDPDVIARELANAHRFERMVISIVRSGVLVALSFATVAALILSFQLILAIISGAPPSKAFPHLPEESIGFVSLTLGYMGLCLEEQLFQTRRLLKAVLLNSALFTLVFLFAFVGLHVTTLAPVVAFVSGVAVRLLQRTVFRAAWLLGTAIPMTAALVIGGTLFSAATGSALWADPVDRAHRCVLRSDLTFPQIRHPN